MKRKVLFTIAHLLLIFITVLHSFFNQMKFNDENLVVATVDKISRLIRIPVLHQYLQLSNIDTGYGFYGGNVATSKFFLLELNNIEKEVVLFNEFKSFFNSKNTYIRFEVLTSKLYDFMISLDELEEQIDTLENEEMSNILERRAKLQKKWIETIYDSLEGFSTHYVNKTNPQLYEKVVSGTIYFKTILPPNHLPTYFKEKRNKSTMEVVTIQAHKFHLN